MEYVGDRESGRRKRNSYSVDAHGGGLGGYTPQSDPAIQTTSDGSNDYNTHFEHFTDDFPYQEEDSMPAFIRAIVNFWSSDDGTRASSEMTAGYAASISLACLALLLATAFDVMSVHSYKIFMGVMYFSSIFGLVTLWIMHKLHKLTSDTSHANRRKTSFVRGGMLVLGSGGFLHGTMELTVFLVYLEECNYQVEVVVNVLGLLFILTQVAFLLSKSEIRINASIGAAHWGRLVLMQVVATNVCVWLQTILDESLHELYVVEGQEAINNSRPRPTGPPGLLGNDPRPLSLERAPHVLSYTIHLNDGSRNSCSTEGLLEGVIIPYTFPLLIEFCVVASGMLLATWERCGLVDVYLGHSSSMLSLDSSTGGSTSGSTSDDQFTQTFSANNRDSNVGLIGGWFVLISTITYVLLILYDFYAKGGYRAVVEDTVYYLNVSVSALTMIAIVATMYQMSNLSFTDVTRTGVQHQTDQSILVVTFTALLCYKMLCMISAVGESFSIILDAVVTSMMGLLQNIFLTWFVHQLRATEIEHVLTKPGRQGLEFIRISNISLWLINIFLLRLESTRRTQQKVFGSVAWVLISNIFQPLVILFFFHSAICVAETIACSYSIKPKKRKMRSNTSSYIDLKQASSPSRRF